MVQIYDYSAEEPDFGEYDVSSCYDPATSKNVAFLVQGKHSKVIYITLSVHINNLMTPGRKDQGTLKD